MSWAPTPLSINVISALESLEKLEKAANESWSKMHHKKASDTTTTICKRLSQMVTMGFGDFPKKDLAKKIKKYIKKHQGLCFQNFNQRTATWWHRLLLGWSPSDVVRCKWLWGPINQLQDFRIQFASPRPPMWLPIDCASPILHSTSSSNQGLCRIGLQNGTSSQFTPDFSCIERLRQRLTLTQNNPTTKYWQCWSRLRRYES